jgi:hypothetical protein
MKLPQLSLRELFLLVALVAMGCGWWVDRSRQAALADHWYKQWDSEMWHKTDPLRYFSDPEA